MIVIYHPIQLLLLLLSTIQAANLSANETGIVHLGDSISSPQLVSAVLQINPQLEVVQAVWEASTERIAQLSSLEDLQFRYSMAPLTIGNHETDFGQRFEISQQIPWPGKLRLHGEMADYDANAKHENIATVQLVLATTAKSLFADWYFIHQAMAINKVNQALLNEFHKIAVTRYGAGLASKQDALRAELEVTLLKHQAIVLRRKQQTILAHINTLLNRTPDAPIPPPQKLAEIKFLPDLKLLRTKAMQSRPELKAMVANIHANKTQTELAELAIYPDFKLSAGYNSLWDNDDKRFTIGVGINVPLAQSKRQAAEQEARAKMKQANWHKIDLEAKIKEELQIAYVRVEESLHVLKLYRRQLAPLADENLAAAKADYQSGKGDFLTLISSEKNRMQTQLQTEQALADAHRRFAKLEYAVGSLEPLSSADQVGRKAP